MTELEKALKARIAREGPISISAYMTETLLHPRYGYYRQARPIGKEGDFTTAPEISQIFGELVGLWLADRWEALGRPDPVSLVELGPGRGTLMADILRALQVMPDLRRALDVHLVETNEHLRELQAEKTDATWHNDLSTVPEGPILLVANEFFDAMPIRQFEKTAAGWRERLVDLEDGRLALGLGPPSAQVSLIPEAVAGAPVGAIAEVCAPAISICGDIAQRIAKDGGAALIIDYGYSESAPGDTLQAVRRHEYVDIFSKPGETDLTAHVDFEQLTRAACQAGARVAGPVTQGEFLKALGIEVRAAILSRSTTDKREAIGAAVRRLTAPDIMGDLFKVIGIVPHSMSETPPGFWEQARE